MIVVGDLTESVHDNTRHGLAVCLPPVLVRRHLVDKRENKKRNWLSATVKQITDFTLM